MDENSTQKQIEERLAELPQEVRDAVLSADMGTHIRAIGSKHGLHIDQIGKLEDETMLVMLGFFDPDTFNQQIEEQLAIPAADATALAAEISAEVFAPIREALKHFTETKTAASTTKEAPASVLMVAVEPGLPAITQTPISPIIAAPVAQSSVVSTVAPSTPVPAIPTISMPAAEKMLFEKTIAVAPTIPAPVAPENNLAPTQKPIYKTDPYREPIE